MAIAEKIQLHPVPAIHWHNMCKSYRNRTINSVISSDLTSRCDEIGMKTSESYLKPEYASMLTVILSVM